MANKRAPIVFQSLDDAHVDLTLVGVRRPPVGVTESGEKASSETILDAFASLRPAKRERMVPYPIRLPAAQIAELERLKRERGVVPAEFIRDAVAGCLELLRKA